MDFTVGKATLSFIEGDITKVPADAIVNAANSRLAGGGGVDGAIHWAGGPSIMEELDAIRLRIGRCETGQAVVTGAGRLPAQFVIHAVGPVYGNGERGEADLLASCYRISLKLAQEKGARSITFPSISTGVYGYPMAAAAVVAIRSVAEVLKSPVCGIARVTLVLFGSPALGVHIAEAERLLG